MGQMKIVTRRFSRSEWNSVVEDFADLSLLQTWEYAEASSRTRALEVSRLLFEVDNNIVGAAQAFVRPIPFIGGGAVVINRGPLWQRNPADPSRLAAILAALRAYWVEQKGMYLRVSPAIKSGEVPESLFHGAGYRSAEFSRPWVSARLDLSQAPDLLRRSLRNNWAAALKKAAAAGITVECGIEEKLFEQVWNEFEQLHKEKAFHSTVTPAFLAAFQNIADKSHKLWSFAAEHNGRSLGGIALARYGSVCEYLVGAVNHEGKRLNAGQLLLWSAALNAKEEGYRWLDLGGMDPENTPKGILYFKAGLHAEPYSYAGDFEAYFPGLINKAIRSKLERSLG